MRNYKIKLSALAFGLSLVSCQKYLDVTPTTTTSFIKTAQDCQLILDNYASMNTGYASDMEASADDYFISEAKYSSPDFLNLEDKAIYSWNASARHLKALPQWQNPYQIVYSSNLVLETVEKLTLAETDQTTKNSLKGSALFFRSFAFWTLAQQYTKPYNKTTSTQDPGIPLRTTSDINDVYGRGTVQQTYDRIVQDLRDAASLLPATSTISSRPNKIAAYALLARTYLTMGDYADALSAAKSALALNKTLLNLNSKLPGAITSNTPFNPRFSNPEIIFQSVMYSQPLLNPGFSAANTAFAMINPDLVNLYDNNDLRKKIFIKPNTIRTSLDNSSNPGNQVTVTIPDGTYRFGGNYEPVIGAALFDGLATDEVLLIEAECYARTGNVGAAVADLNMLLKNRYVTGTYVDMSTSVTADQALVKILEERRKELLMRGLRWTDLRRLGLGAVRKTRNIRFTGSTANPIRTETVTATYSLAPNDIRYTLLIPKDVIDISGIEQNQR